MKEITFVKITHNLPARGVQQIIMFPEFELVVKGLLTALSKYVPIENWDLAVVYADGRVAEALLGINEYSDQPHIEVSVAIDTKTWNFYAEIIDGKVMNTDWVKASEVWRALLNYAGERQTPRAPILASLAATMMILLFSNLGFIMEYVEKHPHGF